VAFKHGLGKGLDALLPLEEEDEQLAKGGEFLIPLDRLRANPDQPRSHFEEETLRELADSIREHGVLQPIIAEDSGDGTYLIIAGERRSRAAAMAGLTEIPALIRKYSDNKRLTVALIENIQRENLNPVEEARAYRKLMALTGLSQDELAFQVGKNRSTVANALRLLKLPEGVQEALEEGKLTPGHARALLSVNDAGKQKKLFAEIITRGLSVRESEKRAGEHNAGTEKKKTAKAGDSRKRDGDLLVMEDEFIEALGTKVSIQGDFNRGTLRIDYYSMEDLERLYQIILRKE
jgi:ParB family chromosome partitioning protein